MTLILAHAIMGDKSHIVENYHNNNNKYVLNLEQNMTKLEINDLHVTIDGKEILKGLKSDVTAR